MLQLNGVAHGFGVMKHIRGLAGVAQGHAHVALCLVEYSVCLQHPVYGGKAGYGDTGVELHGSLCLAVAEVESRRRNRVERTFRLSSTCGEQGHERYR